MTTVPHVRFIAFVTLMAAGTTLLLLAYPVETALVAGFDLAAAVFLASCLPLWRETGATALRDRAARDDGGKGLLILVAVAALLAVLTALVRIVESRNGLSSGDVAIVVLTLVLAWVFINTVYAFHYSHLFYSQDKAGDVGGLVFSGDEPPVFSDFCYLAFTIGMTCQVSDIAVETAALRRTVTLHGLLSYAYNLGVLAMVINVLAGLF